MFINFEHDNRGAVLNVERGPVAMVYGFISIQTYLLILTGYWRMATTDWLILGPTDLVTGKGGGTCVHYNVLIILMKKR